MSVLRPMKMKMKKTKYVFRSLLSPGAKNPHLASKSIEWLFTRMYLMLEVPLLLRERFRMSRKEAGSLNMNRGPSTIGVVPENKKR